MEVNAMLTGVKENIGYLRSMSGVSIEKTKKSLIYYCLSKLGYDISSAREVYGYSVKPVNFSATASDDVVYGSSALLQKASCAFIVMHILPLGSISESGTISTEAFNIMYYDFNDINAKRGTVSYGGGVFTDGKYWVIYPCEKNRLDAGSYISIDLESLTDLGYSLLNLISYENIGEKLYHRVLEILSSVLSDMLKFGIDKDLSDYIKEKYGIYVSDKLWFATFKKLLKTGLFVGESTSESFDNEVVESVEVVMSNNIVHFSSETNSKILPKDVAVKKRTPVKFSLKSGNKYSYETEVSSWRGLFLACTDYLLDTIGIDGILSNFGKDFGGFYRSTRKEFELEYSENGFNGDKFPSYKGIYYYGPLAGIRVVDFLKKVSSALGVEFVVEYVDKVVDEE